jgi:hypothetical protein
MLPYIRYLVVLHRTECKLTNVHSHVRPQDGVNASEPSCDYLVLYLIYYDMYHLDPRDEFMVECYNCMCFDKLHILYKYMYF